MRKIRKGSAAVLVLVLALSTVLISKVQAAIGIETDKECSLTFEVDGEYEELKELDIPVLLYQVADVKEDGTYVEHEGYEGLDLGSISSETTAEEWEEKAAKAVAVIDENKPEATAEVTIANGAGAAAELTTGMYLVYAQKVESPTYEYNFTPYLISLPNNYYKVNEDDTWVYEVETGLKTEQKDRFGDLVIDKTLTSYNATLGGATFVFQVEAFKEGESVYSNAHSLVFDGAGTKSLTIPNIPAGANVTVTETYSGSSYEATTAPEQTTVIVAEGEEGNPAHVAFTNEYNKQLNGGSSIVNKFEYNDGDWQHRQLTDSTQE